MTIIIVPRLLESHGTISEPSLILEAKLLNLLSKGEMVAL